MKSKAFRSAVYPWLLAGIASLAVSLFWFAPVSAAADAGYLRIVTQQGTIEGSANDAAHKNWVSVSTVVSADLDRDVQADREASNPSVSELTARDQATGMASGKRQHTPFVIRKEIDKASPLLAQACATGKHIPEIDFDLTTGGNVTHYKLSDVVVTGDERSAGQVPTESISFTYQKIEMTR
jgi:type VI secretion system secreted protein Hcp